MHSVPSESPNWSSALTDVVESIRGGIAASFRLRYVRGTAWRLLFEILFIVAFWAILSQLVWLMTGSPLLVFDPAAVRSEPSGGIPIAQDFAMLLLVVLLLYRAFVAWGMVICYAAADAQVAEPRAIRALAEVRCRRLVRTEPAAQAAIVGYALLILCPTLVEPAGFFTSILSGVNALLSAPLLLLFSFILIRLMTGTDSVGTAFHYAGALIRGAWPSVVACVATFLFMIIGLQEIVRVSDHLPMLGHFGFFMAYMICLIELLLLPQFLFAGLLIFIALYRRLQSRVAATQR